MVHGAVQGGGSYGLAELLDTRAPDGESYGEAVEADLKRYFGERLSDWVRGDLSPRYVLNLIDKLPDDSALAAMLAAHPPPPSKDPERETKPSPEWKRFYGWGVDRVLRYQAVQVDQKHAKRWAAVLPKPMEKKSSGLLGMAGL